MQTLKSKKTIEFMKECENSKLSFRKAYEKAVINLGFRIRMKEFKIQAKKHGIIFSSSIEPDVSDVSPEIKQFIIRKKKSDLFVLRDEIIIGFEQNLKISKIKRIITEYEIKHNANKFCRS